jgi:nitroreductase
MLARRSRARVVGDDAPDRDELLELLEAASTVADHGALAPWRVIELRGDARLELGRALAQAEGRTGSISDKPLRAPLLLAVVSSRRPSPKAPEWEQDATASGVAHALTLLLDEAGWGVIWRTGGAVRSSQVRELHRLGQHEDLLGWLYVGRPDPSRPPKPRAGVDVASRLSSLDA